MSEDARNQPDDAVFETCRRILREHDVSTALVFGSAADPERAEWHDLDLVVEFATERPGDDGSPRHPRYGPTDDRGRTTASR